MCMTPTVVAATFKRIFVDVNVRLKDLMMHVRRSLPKRAIYVHALSIGETAAFATWPPRSKAVNRHHHASDDATFFKASLQHPWAATARIALGAAHDCGQFDGV
jgi:hypothetical protein